MKYLTSLILASSILASGVLAANGAPNAVIVIAAGAGVDQYGHLPVYRIPAGAALTVLNFTQAANSSPLSSLTVQKVDAAGTPVGSSVTALYAGVAAGDIVTGGGAVSDANQAPAPRLVIPGPAQIGINASTGGTTNLLFTVTSGSPNLFAIFEPGNDSAAPFNVPAGYRLEVLHFIGESIGFGHHSFLFSQQLDVHGNPMGAESTLAECTIANLSVSQQDARTPGAGGQTTVVGPAKVSFFGGGAAATYAAFALVPNN